MYNVCWTSPNGVKGGLHSTINCTRKKTTLRNVRSFGVLLQAVVVKYAKALMYRVMKLRRLGKGKSCLKSYLPCKTVMSEDEGEKVAL